MIIKNPLKTRKHYNEIKQTRNDSKYLKRMTKRLEITK